MHKVFGALSLVLLLTSQFAEARGCRPGMPCFRRGGPPMVMGGGCRPGMPCFRGGGQPMVMGGGCRPGMPCFQGGGQQVSGGCRPGMPCFQGGGQQVSGGCRPGMPCFQGGGQSFSSPFNSGVASGPSSFIPGTNGTTDPRFVSNGDPAQVFIISDNFGRRGEARDAFNNVIATTTQFQQGRPVFDTASTGLTPDGFRRVASVAQSSTGQVPTGTTLPDAGLLAETLTDGSKRWVQTRPGFTNQPIEVVTGPGVVFQQSGNQLTQVQGSTGDLVTRDQFGRLVLVDKNVASELGKKYQAYTADERKTLEQQGVLGLADSVVARQAQIAGSGTTTPGTSTPGTGGSHTGGTPGSNTPVRPIDNSTAPSAWTEYKEKFEKGELPDSASVGEFVKRWGDPDTIKDGRPTVPLKMKCVSNADKNTKNPMTLFLSRTLDPAKPGEWLTNVRLDAGEVDTSKAEIEKNRDRESLLLPQEANKSWSASRAFFPSKVDYDLRTIKVDGKLKFWMKVTSSLDTGKLDYLCGESEPARKEPNDAPKPPEPRPDPPKPDETKPDETKPDEFQADAEIAGRTQLSAKDAKSKLPELLGKCATCHAPGKKQEVKMSVTANGVNVRTSEAADKASAAELILGRMDDMVDDHGAAMGLTSDDEKAKLKAELQAWARTAGGVLR